MRASTRCGAIPLRYLCCAALRPAPPQEVGFDPSAVPPEAATIAPYWAAGGAAGAAGGLLEVQEAQGPSDLDLLMAGEVGPELSGLDTLLAGEPGARCAGCKYHVALACRAVLRRAAAVVSRAVLQVCSEHICRAVLGHAALRCAARRLGRPRGRSKAPRRLLGGWAAEACWGPLGGRVWAGWQGRAQHLSPPSLASPRLLRLPRLLRSWAVCSAWAEGEAAAQQLAEASGLGEAEATEGLAAAAAAAAAVAAAGGSGGPGYVDPLLELLTGSSASSAAVPLAGWRSGRDAQMPTPQQVGGGRWFVCCGFAGGGCGALRGWVAFGAGSVCQ